MGLDQGVGVMAWSPLMFGLLSGKIRRDSPQMPPRAGWPRSARPSKWTGRGSIAPWTSCWQVAAARDVTPAQVAINWVRCKPGVDTVILGARNEEQLRDNLASAAWELSAEEMSPPG